MKQTAVDWLKLQLEKYGDPQYCELTWKELDELCEQAKDMEKEQIVDAFGVGCQVESTRLVGYHGMAEQYYTENYGK